jgi:hypothetical protein
MLVLNSSRAQSIPTRAECNIWLSRSQVCSRSASQRRWNLIKLSKFHAFTLPDHRKFNWGRGWLPTPIPSSKLPFLLIEWERAALAYLNSQGPQWRPRERVSSSLSEWLLCGTKDAAATKATPAAEHTDQRRCAPARVLFRASSNFLS